MKSSAPREFGSLLLQRWPQLDWPRQLPPLVLFSGGADSSFLLLAMLGLAQLGRLQQPIVLHIDHGLRKESEEDARAALALCRQLDLSVFLERRRVDLFARRAAMNLEEAGRELRYRIASRLAQKLGGAFLCTGHHADDYVESVLLHWLRGGGPGALATLPLWSMRGEVRLCRPLLCLSAAEIREALRLAGVPWREDASNQSDQYRRNRLRHSILPALQAEGLDAPRLWRLSHALPEWQPAGAIVDHLWIDRRLLTGASPAACKSAFDPALRRLQLAPLSASAALELSRLLASGERPRLRYRCSQWLLWSDERSPFWLLRADCALLQPACWSPGSNEQTLLRYNGQQRNLRLAAGQELRLFEPGMRLQTAGGTRKLKQWFQEQSVPAPFRSCLPLVYNPASALVEQVLLSFVPGLRDGRFSGKAPPAAEAGLTGQ
ncbi:MAG: tRNA lysidine(34) synthetase TilS [Leptospirales bacterium]|nr:tRNA lysidine(34) synthetase TilS [Leptospirales bacterium]